MATTSGAGGSPRLTTRDRVRRLGLAVVVVLCLGLLALGAAAVREVDANGDVVADHATIPTASPSRATTTWWPSSRPVRRPVVLDRADRRADDPADGAEILQQQQIGIDLGNVNRVRRLVIDRTPSTRSTSIAATSSTRCSSSRPRASSSRRSRPGGCAPSPRSSWRRPATRCAASNGASRSRDPRGRAPAGAAGGLRGVQGGLRVVAAEGRWIGGEPSTGRPASIWEDVGDPLVIRARRRGRRRSGVVSAEHDAHNRVGLGMGIVDGYRSMGIGPVAGCRRPGGPSTWRPQALLEGVAQQRGAIGLYEKFGFVVEGRHRRHWRRNDGSLWDQLSMGLVLDEDAPGGPRLAGQLAGLEQPAEPASSSTGTFSSSALVTLAWPGASPTTTAVVFFDTLPGDLPPRSVIAGLGLLPAEALEGAGDDDGHAHQHLGAVGSSTRPEVHPGAGASRRRPGWRARRTTSGPMRAIVGPTPSTAASSSSARRRCRRGCRRRARRLGAGGPEVADVEADEQLLQAVAAWTPRWRRGGCGPTPRRSPRVRCGPRSGRRCRRVVHQAQVGQELTDPLSPRPSMSIAPRRGEVDDGADPAGTGSRR